MAPRARLRDDPPLRSTPAGADDHVVTPALLDSWSYGSPLGAGSTGIGPALDGTLVDANGNTSPTGGDLELLHQVEVFKRVGDVDDDGTPVWSWVSIGAGEFRPRANRRQVDRPGVVVVSTVVDFAEELDESELRETAMVKTTAPGGAVTVWDITAVTVFGGRTKLEVVRVETPAGDSAASGMA